MQTSRESLRKFPQPLDRVAIALMFATAFLIGILLLSGDRSAPRVRDFNWQGKQIGADDRAFLLTFSRPMDHASVEKNLRIQPELKGKVSWAGRRMAYTFDQPAPYGAEFTISLESARDRFSKEGSSNGILQPFRETFKSRDRSFAFIGAEGNETGRLILYNMTQQDKKVLTPENLTVMDFKAYPGNDKILFSAIERTNPPQSLAEQKLYTVTTGIHINDPVQLGSASTSTASASPTQVGQITEVLDNRDYQNLKFDLSRDGSVIVIQRLSRRDPNDAGAWILREGQPAQPIDNRQTGGDFLITPDGGSLAVAQGQGLAILPLKPQSEQSQANPLDFLPKFGTVLSFSQDGSAAAMVKFNTDYTRSMFLVSQGVQKEILKIPGSIISAEFDANNQFLYCLLTNLLPGTTFQEQPFLAAIDLKAAREGKPMEQTLRPLVLLPNQRETTVDLAPDGKALIFDQTQADDRAKAEGGQAVANSRLWLLPLKDDLTAKTQPEELPFAGLHPRWLP
ncbi:hypothetical protein Q2T42_28225 [Leptolyngbya boryana CZ1]|uniref:SbsA Ig-like domain-containing protein n=1 Tax=Leptolyngbya boryana CZ1 TaxID=3060204 RepID=A0AA96WWY0_LEPBY|nr:hypothetical protein [Leptolyngbya boryana]WNZ45679.1 hypothetical protein Q2T42_28225 [Leptolyngbya boryana CZ1]